jgi:hypothetical protein
VVVDRKSKQAVFIPTDDNVTSEQVAKLFLIHVFSKHGVPSHITSDRGTEFVAQFFRSLAELLNITLHFTSGYHPEADGQTEHTNQTLEQYIRMYCSYQQDNWNELLPLVEFAYNNAPNASTGITPFFANKGYHPAIEVYPERDVASVHARNYAVNLQELHKFLHSEITLAQERYKEQADRHRIPFPPLSIGDSVFVISKNIKTTHPTRKFTEQLLGPYEVIAKPSTHAYTLRLPKSMRSIHPVFHVSQLEPFAPSSIPGHKQSPHPAIEIDGEDEYEIEEIVESKIDKRRRCKLLYKVHWAGYENTDEWEEWLPADELHHAQELIEEFHLKYPEMPGPLSSLELD